MSSAPSPADITAQTVPIVCDHGHQTPARRRAVRRRGRGARGEPHRLQFRQFRGGQPANEITVSSNQCGGAWQLAKPGWHTFEINNQGTGGAEVDLVDPANGAIYAEVENTGPATVTPDEPGRRLGQVRVPLLRSPTSTRSRGSPSPCRGTRPGTPAIMPITYNDLIPLAKKYVTEEEAAIKVMAPETATLAAAVQQRESGGGAPRLADRAPAVRDAGRRLRRVRELRRRDRRPGRRGRGAQPAVDRLLPAGVRAVARAVAEVARARRRTPSTRTSTSSRSGGPPRRSRWPTSGGAPTRSSRTRSSSSSPGTTTTAAAPPSRARPPPSTPAGCCSPCCTRCSRPGTRGCPRSIRDLTSCRRCLTRNGCRAAGGFPNRRCPSPPGRRSTPPAGRSLQELAPIAAITEPRNSLNAF